MERTRGFSLVELMLVVSIIAIIAAVAIPSLLNSRKSAIEASVIGRLRTLITVSEQYRVRFGSYADNYTSLQNSGLFDAGAFFGKSNTYDLSYTGGTYSWSCTADPTVPGTTGDRYFYVDQSGVIRYELSGTAGPTSPPID